MNIDPEKLLGQLKPRRPEATLREQVLSAVAGELQVLQQRRWQNRFGFVKVAQRVFNMMSQCPIQTTTPSNRKKNMGKLVTLATAVLITIAVGSSLLIDRTASKTFAAVIERVQRAKSVTCLLKSKDSNTAKATAQKIYVRDDAIRIETTGFGALIFDLKQEKALVLDERKKVAKFPMVIPRQGAPIPNPLEKMCNLRQENAERLEDETLDGKKVEVYRLKSVPLMENDIGENIPNNNKSDIKLWVDSQTQLPAKFVISPPKTPTAGSPYMPVHVEYSDFRWNENLDPSLFSLEVPKGYTVQKESPEQPEAGKSETESTPAAAAVRVEAPPAHPAEHVKVKNLVSGYDPIIKNTIFVTKSGNGKGGVSSTSLMDMPTSNENPSRHNVQISNGEVSVGCQYVGRAGLNHDMSKVDVYVISVKIGDQPEENIPVIYSGGEKIVVNRPEIQLSLMQKAKIEPEKAQREHPSHE
jgi:outer membrane lipoprotein-sorting protein